MTSETALTGRNGKLVVTETLIRRLTQWAVNPTLATSSEWGDSDGEGYTNRAAGRRDGTFTTEGKYDTEDEVWDIFHIGDIVKATLFLNNSGGLLYWAFPRALCNDFNLTINVDTEEVVGWTAGWGADGKFYFPGQEDAPAETIPE